MTTRAMTMPRRTIFALLLCLAAFGAQRLRAQPAPDSVQVVEAVEAFRAALARGDSAAVAQALLPESVVLESGGVETKREYLGHHFHADHAFLKNVARDVQSREVRVEGRAAWVSTASRMTGTYEGRDLDLASAELLVLRHRPGGWRIAAVHWSSRSRE